MSRVFTGAKAQILIDGIPLVFVSSITINHENRLEEIPQLDNLEVAEYAENGHRCSFTINLFKVNENAAALFDLDPVNIKELLLQQEMIVQVLDETTGEPVYEMLGVKSEGGTGSLDARGVWQGSWNFKARRGRGL